jgi:transposase
MTRQARTSPEVRAVRMVFEHRGEPASTWATIGSMAGEVGCTAETLRGRVRRSERDRGVCAGPATDERIAAPERAVRALRQAHGIARKASAYRAMAALDRRSRPGSPTSTAAPLGSRRSAKVPPRRDMIPEPAMSTVPDVPIPRSCRPAPKRDAERPYPTGVAISDGCGGELPELWRAEGLATAASGGGGPRDGGAADAGAGVWFAARRCRPRSATRPRPVHGTG